MHEACVTCHENSRQWWEPLDHLIAALTSLVVIVLVTSAGVAGALDDVSVPGLVVACAAAGSLALLHASIAFTVGAATGRRATALGTATTIALAGYLLHGLLGINEALEPLRFATPWHWYLGRNGSRPWGVCPIGAIEGCGARPMPVAPTSEDTASMTDTHHRPNPVEDRVQQLIERGLDREAAALGAAITASPHHSTSWTTARAKSTQIGQTDTASREARILRLVEVQEGIQ